MHPAERVFSSQQYVGGTQTCDIGEQLDDHAPRDTDGGAGRGGAGSVDCAGGDAMRWMLRSYTMLRKSCCSLPLVSAHLQSVSNSRSQWPSPIPFLS